MESEEVLHLLIDHAWWACGGVAREALTIFKKAFGSLLQNQLIFRAFPKGFN